MIGVVMKKFLLLSSLLFLANCVFAYPNIEMNVGGTPFLLLQQQNFQKNEVNSFRQFVDADDRPATNRVDSPKQLQDEYKLKNMKKPAKINLGQPKTHDMELIQQDGQVRIKYVD